jgi:hypothetical protein
MISRGAHGYRSAGFLSVLAQMSLMESFLYLVNPDGSSRGAH